MFGRVVNPDFRSAAANFLVEEFLAKMFYPDRQDPWHHCHPSIYNLWLQVLDYFDAFLVGLTATPDNYGFFKNNVVSDYSHEIAVADGVREVLTLSRNRAIVQHET